MVTKFGIAIAQSGTPIARASDYQRIIDTRWKTMSVVATKEINITDAFATAQVIKILDHNLGYLPAFEAPFYNTRFEVQTSNEGGYLFLSDRNSIYLVVPDVYPFDYTIKGSINVYDLNMEVDYQGEDRGLIGSVGRSDRGIKVIGNGQYAARDVRDTDPIGFSITTDSKAIGVDKIGTVNVVAGRGVIPHTLNYPPLINVVSFYNRTNIFSLGNQVQPPSNSDAFCGPLELPATVKVEPQAVVLESAAANTYRFVIFKEPTEIAG